LSAACIDSQRKRIVSPATKAVFIGTLLSSVPFPHLHLDDEVTKIQVIK
jgi:hypothetical protein